jgi:hypothetical protein
MDFKKKILIATGVATIFVVVLGMYVYNKKQNNADWKLLRLPTGRKSDRRIIINRTN